MLKCLLNKILSAAFWELWQLLAFAKSKVAYPALTKACSLQKKMAASVILGFQLQFHESIQDCQQDTRITQFKLFIDFTEYSSSCQTLLFNFRCCSKSFRGRKVCCSIVLTKVFKEPSMLIFGKRFKRRWSAFLRSFKFNSPVKWKHFCQCV